MLLAPLLSLAPLQVALPLTALDIAEVRQDWGSARSNKSVDGHPLTIGGKVFPTGLGTHANSTFDIDLQGSVKAFSASVGVDSEVGTQGSVIFEVWADGKKRWSSGVMLGGQAAKPCHVDLTGAKRLKLVVTDADQSINYDHADWAEAVFTLTPGKGRPKAKLIPVGPTMKIASGVSPMPEIHAPHVVGCSPNAPFLFLIPATGAGKLSYQADHLPKGLRLDSQSGILSGRVAAAGTYRVNLTVRGAKGSRSEPLTIICGTHKLAQTPPMGWNSWNVWGPSVDRDKVKAAAENLIKTGLARFGYAYVNIDDAWEAQRDTSGEIFSNEKFGDMSLLGNEVHRLGLKLGIYSSPGPKTCANYEGSYQHEAQDAKSWASWGIDYIKYDWCSYGNIAKDGSLPELQKPYALMREALDGSGRDIVFSLCQYGMGDVWNWGGKIGGNLWRTTGDINDSWSSMSGIGFSGSKWAPGAGPGHWNDPDMLVVGRLGWGDHPRPTKLTPNEQITHITLWSMLAAPLILGCDLTKLDTFTKDLLTNPEVLEIDQDALGKPARQVWKQGDLEIWTRPLADKSLAVAFFNRGPDTATIKATWGLLGRTGNRSVRDLWLRKDLGRSRGLSRSVYPHAAMLFKVR